MLYDLVHNKVITLEKAAESAHQTLEEFARNMNEYDMTRN